MPQGRLTVQRLSLPAAVIICAAIIGVAAWIHFWLGRPPVCQCGSIKLWYGGRDPAEMSQHFTDYYTYSHILHGIIFYWLLSLVSQGRLSVAARLVIAMSVEAGWEIFENTPFIINRYRTGTISKDYLGDSILNSVGDMVAMLVGFLIASRLPAWVTVLLVIITEFVMLALLRDNLTLNIIMLIHPVEWIAQWQALG
jgi:hypothetical protein